MQIKPLIAASLVILSNNIFAAPDCSAPAAPQVQWQTCNKSGLNLTSANLSQAFLMLTKFTGANLTNANLNYADLRGANLESATLTGANLTGARLLLATWTDGRRCTSKLPGRCF